MAKNEQQQPRAISPDLSLVPARYRAGMHAELQKFGDWKGARQLLLSETMGADLAQEPGIEVTGLGLSVSEDRALSALQILMDKTGYRGNIPGEEKDLEAWKWRGGPLPRLAITYSDYFEAYGLQRKARGDYYGRQTEEALKALDSLTEPRRIVYERKRWESKGQKRRRVSDMIVRRAPLITLTRLYKGLEEEEAAQVRAGQDISGRVTGLLVEFGPLLVDGISDYFLLKPTTLHQEIKEVLGARRVSRAVSLFIEWLLTLNLPEIAIGREALAGKLRLDYLIEQRKRSQVEERLQEAIETALELEYLLGYELDALGVYHLTLNPDRMGRPPKWRLKAGEDEDEEG